jgi:hypothetical protein
MNKKPLPINTTYLNSFCQAIDDELFLYRKEVKVELNRVYNEYYDLLPKKILDEISYNVRHIETMPYETLKSYIDTIHKINKKYA